MLPFFIVAIDYTSAATLWVHTYLVEVVFFTLLLVSQMFNLRVCLKFEGMDFHELLDIPQGDRRKYHDDVSVMVISLEGRIWRSFG